MSIRPVDLQVSLPKSLEITKADNNLSQRPDAQQQEFSELFQRKTEQANKQVIESNETEKSNIDKDGKNNSNEKERKKKKQGSNDTNKKLNKNSSSMYDISV